MKNDLLLNGASPLKFNQGSSARKQKIKLKKYYELPFSNKFFRAIPRRL
jgi:hypothetical protein